MDSEVGQARPLGDLVTLQRGTTYKSGLLGEPGPVLLGLATIHRNGGFRDDSLRTYGGESPAKLVLGPGDLYVSLKDVTQAGDLVGAVSRVPRTVEAGRLTQDTVRLDVIEGAVDAHYLYWLLRTPLYRSYCRARAIGTTNLSLAREDFLAFAVPPLTEGRHSLVMALEAIDARIELNRRMNDTLESIARIIFNSWFVDFDPVRRQMESGDAGLPPDLGSLFPSSLAASPIGPIPDGWRVATIGDVAAELEAGSRPAGGVGGVNCGIPSIGAESIVGVGRFDYAKTKYVTSEFRSAMRRGHVKDRDVLVYKDGGRPGMFEPHVTLFGDGFPFEECCINEHVYRLRVSTPLSQSYIFFWLSSAFCMGEMRERGTGVAIPSLNTTAFRSVPVLVPDTATVELFTSLVEPMVAGILASARHSRTLQLARDALLPQLSEGQAPDVLGARP